MELDWYNDYMKECENIENQEICSRCGKVALVHAAEYDYLFACASCGARFEFDGRYQEELDYYIASKQ